MITALVGLPFILLGIFTRNYTIKGVGSCFAVEFVDWGPFCFAEGSILPKCVEYGSLCLGAMLLGLTLCRAPASWRDSLPKR